MFYSLLTEEYLEQCTSSTGTFNDYLHGDCHKVVYTLQQLYPLGTPVLLMEYDDYIQEDCLLHAVLRVGDKFIDIRGVHHSIDSVLDAFDYGDFYILEGMGYLQQLVQNRHLTPIQQYEFEELTMFVQRHIRYFT